MVSGQAKPVSGVVSAKPCRDLPGFWFRGRPPSVEFWSAGGVVMPLAAETGDGNAVVGGILFFAFIVLAAIVWLRPNRCRHCGRCRACGRQR